MRNDYEEFHNIEDQAYFSTHKFRKRKLIHKYLRNRANSAETDVTAGSAHSFQTESSRQTSAWSRSKGRRWMLSHKFHNLRKAKGSEQQGQPKKLFPAGTNTGCGVIGELESDWPPAKPSFEGGESDQGSSTPASPVQSPTVLAGRLSEDGTAWFNGVAKTLEGESQTSDGDGEDVALSVPSKGLLICTKEDSDEDECEALPPTSKHRLKCEAKGIIKEWWKQGSTGSTELSFRNRGWRAIYGLRKLARDDTAKKRLAVLDLEKNVLYKVPKHIVHFECLSELLLGGNKLNENSFPMDMSTLKKLRLLQVSHNKIKSFPRAFTTLPKLEYLDLHDNILHELIPPQQSKEQLQEFMTALYSTLGKTLKSLDLGVNDLEGKLSEPFFEAMLKLEQLSLHTNKIKTLPLCFKFMEHLKVLRASGNPLQVPPLSVVNSGPDSVRRFLWSLTKDGVRRLNPSHHIDRADDDTDDHEDTWSTAGAASALSVAESFDARSVKSSISEMLQQVTLSGSSSRQLDIPDIQVESDASNTQNPSPISGNTDAHKTASSRSFKVVVLGMSSAGKTSLIQTLANEKRNTEQEERTFGVDIHACVLPTVAGSDVDKPQELTLWDFAGQDVFYRTHQVFLSQRTLYILVWDITNYSVVEIDRTVCFWVYSVQARVPGAVIQIIATKVDMVSEEVAQERIRGLQNRLNQHEMWQINDLHAMINQEEDDEDTIGGDFSSKVSVVSSVSASKFKKPAGEEGFIDGCEFNDLRPQMLLRQRPQVMKDILMVSSAKNIGFDKLRASLSRTVQDTTLFPHVDKLACIPLTWGIVEDAIAALRVERQAKPVAIVEDLEKKIVELSTPVDVLVTQEDILQCLRFLNNIGDIVHNEPANIVFLDSQWIVECIKRVVDESAVKKLVSTGKSRRVRSRNELMKKESIINRDVEHLCEKGILCEGLVPLLWPELFVSGKRGKSTVDTPVYHGLLGVLEEFDVLSPLHTLPNGIRRWLIPCLITKKIDFEKRWPPLKPGDEEVQINRSFVFTRFRPPSIMAKVLTRITGMFDSKSTEARTWKDATILRIRLPQSREQIKLLVHIRQEHVFGPGVVNDSDSEDGGADFDTERAVLDIHVRGSPSDSLVEMWDVVSRCKDVIETILLDEYVGITWVYLVRCPVCVSCLPPDCDISGAHSFQLLDVENFAEIYADELHQDWSAYRSGQKAGKRNMLSMMCEVHSSEIEDHDTPLMWLMPPQFDNHESDESTDGNIPNSSPLQLARSLSAVDQPVSRFLSSGEAMSPILAQMTRQASRSHNFITLPSGTAVDARSICRIGIYCKKKKRFEEQGTGFIINKEKGLIVSACHLITSPQTRTRKFTFSDDSTKTILIGCFESQDSNPPWCYEAELVTCGDSFTGVGIPANSRSISTFLDAMVLRVTHGVDEITTHTKSSVFGVVEVERKQGDYQVLPLPAHIPVGDSLQVQIGELVSLIGFPLKRGETICMDSGSVVGFGQKRDEIHAKVFNHDGSSGGPLINSAGEVVGILSRSTTGDLAVHISFHRVLPLLNCMQL
uniref:Roc domain-containing protein n=1 Tax=Mucochytrium quahogii TaxID=96639 RepID=A0A7S2R879_9STRA|mmetsp:Transcript_17736/g.30159  ORF Transcript_17736/g.30159 Transcript_17736/m.30159 type:complete len:1543 (-) Transcript_17736:1690-6318(-)|eukprot:CAMPEP_0203757384 /NCGR_PEP_ID=MMETSP0098-20131031/10473_1 /ASSEMBLY_ACC=CAM_ASM_000208 /TAXON_ID=96639 /ORGANISM=" , Strain NY0313808BC1" /LENGTH=1542 /DNA_ID=CAMNT_0050649593 /DNA_START=301 /DNA_END=4932 /DNA_ORIENTATION=+